MIYKVISKDEFRKFIEGLIESNETFGPRKVDTGKNGDPIYQFRKVETFDELELDYTVTASSLKNFFLPFKEVLSRYSFTDDDWEQGIEYRVNPRVIVGVRACDINALCKLDDIFIHGAYPSPYYLARRNNTFLIGMDHMPLDDCFCRSLGELTVRQGFNLYCTDLGDRYYLSINSSKAFNFLKKVKTSNPTEEDDRKWIERKQLIRNSFKTRVETDDLPNLLDIEFSSPIWKKWGDKCLNCGVCAMVCPTCYCYGVEETIDVSLKKARKERKQYSCTVVDFAEVAGGHNFRPLKEDRLKYRFYHHYHGFAENADKQICVGCNRCGRACLPGINPKDVISDLILESGDDV